MKKILVIFTILVLAFSVVTTVLAENDDSKRETKALGKVEKALERLERFDLPEVESQRDNPASLFVGPQGQTRIIRGEITSLSGTSTPGIDEVKVWGLTLKVDMTGANFIPSGTSRETLKVGDKVNIRGTMDQATAVIKASTVHSLTARQLVNDDILSQITKLIERLRELQQRAGLPLTPLPASSTTPYFTRSNIIQPKRAETGIHAIPRFWYAKSYTSL